MFLYLAMLDLEEDRSKFELLYYVYSSLMYRVAERMLGDRRAAEDVVHEAFLKILEHLDKISDPRCPQTRAFVVIITERKAIDAYRRRRREALGGTDWMNGVEDPAVAAVSEGSPVAQAIARLPARYRSVILLRYDCGYTVREIAEMLDLTEDNVKKTIARAKKKLAALLEEEGIEV